MDIHRTKVLEALGYGLCLFALLRIIDGYLGYGHGLGFPLEYFAIGWFGLAEGFMKVHFLLLDFLVAILIVGVFLHSPLGRIFGVALLLGSFLAVYSVRYNEHVNTAERYEQDLSKARQEAANPLLAAMILCPDVTVCDQPMLTLRKNGQVSSGQFIPPTDLSEFAQDITRTDFAALKPARESGVCAPSFRGPAKLYSFYTARGAYHFWTCAYDIDPLPPIFQDLEEILTRYQ